MTRPTPHYDRARRLLQDNCLAEFDHACRQLIASSEDEPELLLLYAEVVERQHGAAAAVPIFERAADRESWNGDLQEAHAACLERANRLQEACSVRFAQFQRGDRNPFLLMGLARILLPAGGQIEAGRVYRAIDFVREAMQVLERPFDAAVMFVNAVWAGDQAPRALVLLRQTLALTPADADAWRSYAFVLQSEAAMPAARRALACVISLAGDVQARIMRALAISPIQPSRAAMMADRARVDEELDELLADQTLRTDLSGDLGGFMVQTFNFAFHGEDDRPLMEKMAAVFRHADPGLAWKAPHTERPRSPGAPVRIGVVGAFGVTSILLTTSPLFDALDRRRFSVTYYSVDATGAASGGAAGSAAVKNLPWSVRGARELIAADKNDILVYTEVFMTNLFYFLAFSRLARHQLLRPGHPVTSGLDTMDYAVSAWTLERPGAEVDYTETLVHLKELCTDYPRLEPEFGEIGLADLGVPAGRRLYLCSQTWYKLHPDFDEILRRILDADPEGLLLLFENHREAGSAVILERLDRHLGDHAGRVMVLPRQPLDRYLGLLGAVDVMLDTYHFCGGNTTYQALQMGLPMITRPPLYMRGRGTASFYEIMGFEELVAHSDDDYVALAVRVATDRDYRDYCRREILARCDRLFDRADVVREYEDLFEAIIAGTDLAPWRVRPAISPALPG